MAATLTLLEADSDMLAKVRKLRDKFPTQIAGGLYRVANYVMTRSKEQFVPVDDGPLRASGKVLKPVVERANIYCELTYGDASTPYALAVHEHLSEHSPASWKAAENAGRKVQFHPAGRGPKYLERPLMDEAKTFAKDLAKEINIEELWRRL